MLNVVRGSCHHLQALLCLFLGIGFVSSLPLSSEVSNSTSSDEDSDFLSAPFKRDPFEEKIGQGLRYLRRFGVHVQDYAFVDITAQPLYPAVAVDDLAFDVFHLSLLNGLDKSLVLVDTVPPKNAWGGKFSFQFCPVQRITGSDFDIFRLLSEIYLIG